jgi:hypothetical protein
MSAWSQLDCRKVPNSSITINGTVQYTVQTSSNSVIPPTDSRKAGVLVDSREAGLAPQNSRTAPPFED